ncbi:cupin domain-containing protein [Thermoleophilia bacterium SCSIO 60948]|nr:cupin domain-containing protein [Thermoleophilia bacterium SCSIO 60948]
MSSIGTQEKTASATGEWFMGSLLRWPLTSGDSDGVLALGEATVAPGGEPPLHVHAREDETFYVLEGEMLFQRGTERIEARAGTAVFMPRGVEHGFAVLSSQARFAQLFTPGGLEEAFRALSEPAEYAGMPPAPDGPPDEAVIARQTATFGSYGVEFTGPPLPVILGS